MQDFGFHPVFLEKTPGSPVLLLLHGTGGDEHDLLPFAQQAALDAALLSVRGKVVENGMNRFFKRHAEGVFDLEDLRFRTDEMADFITAAKAHHDLKQRRFFALGFSNGANIATSLMFRHPSALDGAVLLRPMVPFIPDPLPNLKDKPVLIMSGLMDSIVPVQESEDLAALYTAAQALVTLVKKPATHQLVQSDLRDVAQFLSQIL